MIRATMTATLLVLALTGQFAAGLFLPGPTGAPAIAAADVGAPAKEPLLRFAFDPPQWGMPDGTAWTHMDISIIEIDPGRSFDTHQGWYTSTDGPLLLYIQQGELTIYTAGPALIYRDAASGPPPVTIDPELYETLEPGDGIVYSIHDAALGINQGAETVRALIGLTGSEDFDVPGAFDPPRDVRQIDENDIDDLPALSTRGAIVSIQQLELAPFDTYSVTPGANWIDLPVIDPLQIRGLRRAVGVIDSISPDLETSAVTSSQQLAVPWPDPYTLLDLGEEPIVLYFLVVEPAPNAGAPAP